jgi:starvation-inducible DNA-binding protein
MDQLIQSLLVAFANNFSFYLKSHNYHWIVQGENFPQYHQFLETIYSDAQESIDDYAEQLRRLGAFPKGDYTSIVSESEITDRPEDLTDPEAMFENLLADLDILVGRLQDTYDLAQQSREYGLQNFLADRIDSHRKQQWMITATLAPEPDEAAGATTDAESTTSTATTTDGEVTTAEGCPIATQDIETNLKNRQTAIDKAHYGPLNPSLPNRTFWMAKADMWNVSAAEAQTSLCGNCAAFNQTPKILDCIDQGLAAGGSGTTEAWDTIKAGDLGYCEAWDFKCASSRTCDAWITGGPIH